MHSPFSDLSELKSNEYLDVKPGLESLEPDSDDLYINETINDQEIEELNYDYVGKNNESLIAEVIEQEAAKINKPCEGQICWAKFALNKALNLNLSFNNTLDQATKQAIANFQLKNNLPQTQRIDSITERALLEWEAKLKHKDTSLKKAAVDIITSAKTKVEDWTKQAQGDGHLITNRYRDPRKLNAYVLHQMAFKRKGRSSRQFSDPTSYLRTRAHFCILFDGRIMQLHAFSRFIWHAQGISHNSVGVEFEGNFPNYQGKWWNDANSTIRNNDVPTPAQYEAGRFLASYLKIVLGTTHILAHRQSSSSRDNDPGPDIWYNIGEWAISKLGMTDGGPTFKTGTGRPILSEWRTWGDKSRTLIKRETDDYENISENEDFRYENMQYKDSQDEDSQYEDSQYEDYTESQSEDEEFEPKNEVILEYDTLEESLKYDPQFRFDQPPGKVSLIDLPNAIRMNRYYGNNLGWRQYYDLINNLLLQFSGQSNMSLDEEAFAKAVAVWQQKQGFSATEADGIIGPHTWARIKPFLDLGNVSNSKVNPIISKNEDSFLEISQFIGIRNVWSWPRAIMPYDEVARRRGVIQIKNTGVTDVVLHLNTITNGRDGSDFRLIRRSRANVIENIKHTIRDLENENLHPNLHLMLFPNPNINFLRSAITEILPILNEINIKSVLLDAEDNWRNHGRPGSHRDGVDLLLNDFKSRLGHTLLGFTDWTLTDKGSVLANICDYVMPQAYSISSRDRNLRNPGEMQLKLYEKFEPLGKKMIFALAGWDLLKPKKYPNATDYQTMAYTLNSLIEKYSPSEVAYWWLPLIAQNPQIVKFIQDISSIAKSFSPIKIKTI